MASILVVDDERALRAVIRSVLERRGHSVMEAENGKDALLLCQSTAFDLVVSDLLMPDFDGLELLMALRKAPSRPQIAVMTGAAEKGPFNHLGTAKSLGAAVVLQKPFSAHRFLEAIDPLIGDRAVGGPLLDAGRQNSPTSTEGQRTER